ncbi:MAG: ABC transporter substrate-binding protein [Candidatus Latescibacterota bacterium]
MLALPFLTRGPGAEPYQSFQDRGAQFLGPGRELEPPDTLSCVRLGLIGPSRGDSGLQLRRGAQIAVSEANAAGGYRGLPYVLVSRPDDGPWGVVAAQVVRLSQEDQVWAVVGALDGERAHAAELVAAKVWVPVITPAAGDLTLDYANVPWVFRLAPTDRAQADLLLEASRERGWERLALATEGVRDARLAAERVQEAVAQRQRTLALHLEYVPGAPEATVERLRQVRPDGLLIWGTPAGVEGLLEALQAAGGGIPLLLPASLVVPQTAGPAAAAAAPAPALAAAAADPGASDAEVERFASRFREETGVEPTPTAVLAYDAVRLVMQAVERAGLNRARIRDELASAPFTGLSGPVSFSSLGGSGAQPTLVEARAGRWVPARPPPSRPRPGSTSTP